jgi:hypothetical protein
MTHFDDRDSRIYCFTAEFFDLDSLCCCRVESALSTLMQLHETGILLLGEQYREPYDFRVSIHACRRRVSILDLCKCGPKSPIDPGRWVISRSVPPHRVASPKSLSPSAIAVLRDARDDG